MKPDLELRGEGGERTVWLLGEEIGSGKARPEGPWDFRVDVPGSFEGIYAGGDTLEQAWARVLRDAERDLVRTGERLVRVAAWRERVVAQAGDDWMDLKVDEAVAPGGVLRVPRVPFVRWALRDANRHLWPEWENVCPGGMKMRNDDRNHTDWMVGAGLDPAVFYKVREDRGSRAEMLTKASYRALFDVQAEMLNFGCAVLSGTGRFVGRAWHAEKHPGEAPPRDRVIVLPNASVRWTDVLVAAGDAGQAVIVEVGGAGAHLASLGRERGVRLVRVEDARRLYPDPWTELAVDCDRGSVSILT